MRLQTRWLNDLGEEEMCLTFANIVPLILLHRSQRFQLSKDMGLASGDGNECMRLTWQQAFVSVSWLVSSW